MGKREDPSQNGHLPRGKSEAYKPELASLGSVADGGDPAPDCISRRSRASSAARVLGHDN